VTSPGSQTVTVYKANHFSSRSFRVVRAQGKQKTGVHTTQYVHY